MFTGFCKETSEFLWELAFHNERPWFQEHKETFEKVLNEPFKALAAETYALLCEKYPDDPFRLHAARIYRDARRLYGRGPYKENLWFTIWEEPSDDMGGPVFWFEINKAFYAFGTGFWGGAEQMELYRKTIDANPPAFERVIRKIEKNKMFTVDGETYKREKGNYSGSLAHWYNLRHISVSCRKDFGGDLFSEALPGILVERYSELMPLFRYLNSLMNKS
jgi:uncharacterized protein (TIGR02453 family)